VTGRLTEGVLEEPLEAGDYAPFDEICYSPKCAGNGFTGNLLRPSNIEDWHQGKVGLRLYCRVLIAKAGLEPGEYLVCFDTPGENLVMNNAGVAGDRKINTRLNDRGGRNRQRAVLVPIADGLEQVEKPGLRELPAVVRLYAIRGGENAPWHTPEGRSLRVGKLLPACCYREAYAFLLGKSLRSRQCENHVVERGTLLVNDLTDESGVDQRKRFDTLYAKDEPLFTIYVTPQSIELALKEPLGDAVQSFDLFACSL